jgi:hypothetical protein
VSYGRGTERRIRTWGRGIPHPSQSTTAHAVGASPPAPPPLRRQVMSPPAPPIKPKQPLQRDDKIGIGTMIALAAFGVGVAVYAFSPTPILSFGTRPPDPLPDPPDPDSEEEIDRRRARNAASLEEQRRDIERIQDTIGHMTDDYDDYLPRRIDDHMRDHARDRARIPVSIRPFGSTPESPRSRDRTLADPYPQDGQIQQAMIPAYHRRPPR